MVPIISIRTMPAFHRLHELLLTRSESRLVPAWTLNQVLLERPSQLFHGIIMGHAKSYLPTKLRGTGWQFLVPGNHSILIFFHGVNMVQWFMGGQRSSVGSYEVDFSTASRYSIWHAPSKLPKLLRETWRVLYYFKALIVNVDGFVFLFPLLSCPWCHLPHNGGRYVGGLLLANFPASKKKGIRLGGPCFNHNLWFPLKDIQSISA